MKDYRSFQNYDESENDQFKNHNDIDIFVASLDISSLNQLAQNKILDDESGVQKHLFLLDYGSIKFKCLQDGKVGGKVGDEKSASSHWAMSFFDRGPALAVTPDGESISVF